MNYPTWLLLFLFTSLFLYLIVHGAMRMVQRTRYADTRKTRLLEKARARRKVAVKKTPAYGSQVHMAGAITQAWKREKKKHRRSVIIRRSTFPPA